MLCSVLLTAALLASAPSAAELATLSAKAPTKEEVTSDKDREGIGGIRGAKATFIVAADRDVVLDTLWDVEAFPEIFPDIDRMKILTKEKDRVDVHFEIDAVVTDAEYNLRRRLDRKTGEIRWQEFGEGDVKHIRGAWTVEPTGVPGFARVIYSSYVDVGRFVPDGPVRALAIRKIDEMAERVRGAVKRTASVPAPAP
jgi:ribosome-associated toxin RatA of RatAB toxin-antitoxin module